VDNFAGICVTLLLGNVAWKTGTAVINNLERMLVSLPTILVYVSKVRDKSHLINLN